MNIKKLNEKLNRIINENIKESVDIRYATEEDMYNGTITDKQYLDSFEYIYSSLVNGNISQYRNQLKRLKRQGDLKDYLKYCEEMNLNPKVERFLESYNSKRKIQESNDHSKIYTLRDAVKEIKDNLEDYDDEDYARIDEHIDEEIDRVLTYNEDAINMWKELFFSSSANNGNEVINLMQDDIRSYLRDKVQ